MSIGLFSFARAGLAPLVSAIFPIPKIALLPLFVIWFGIGEGSKVATILFGTFFPTVIATYGGVDNVDRNLIRMGQSFGLSWSSIVRKIILPGALPAILSGFRISASIAIVLLVAAEMISGDFGLGYMIMDSYMVNKYVSMVMAMISLGFVGWATSAMVRWAGNRMMQWRVKALALQGR